MSIKKGDKRIINGWTFYDWANSVYPLVITTAIFPIFYEGVSSVKVSAWPLIGQVNHTIYDRVEFFGSFIPNSALYSYVISLGFLIVAILSPMLSGVADYSGNKKSFLKFFCYLGAASCAMLYFFDIDAPELSMIPVLLAGVGFWGSLVFYNAYLPEIAEPKDHDHISAKGFSRGYVGASLLLIICLVMVIFHDVFGMESGFAVRLSFVLTAIWWAGFAQVTYRVLPNNVYGRKPSGNRLLQGFKEMRKVMREFAKTRRLKRFLIAFFVFSMGVQTVMYMATIFGSKEVENMPATGLIVAVLLIQFVAIPGAYFFSWFSQRVGNLRSLSLALFIWVGVCIYAYFIQTANQYYIAAGLVGLVMGGIQSLSRSTYSKFLPETEDHASYFSFYDVTEKLGIVIGTASYGYIEVVTGSMRNSTFALMAFFLVGYILLLLVPKQERSLQKQS